MNPVVRTPDLNRSLADYTRVLGFDCLRHVPGVVALVAHGSLQLQLRACGARPGRWERPGPVEGVFAPCHLSVAVTHIHALHASLRRAVLREVRTGLEGSRPLHGDRLRACVPRLQAWGAWEFEFRDVDGHVIHCVDWMLPVQDELRRHVAESDPLAEEGDT